MISIIAKKIQLTLKKFRSFPENELLFLSLYEWMHSSSLSLWCPMKKRQFSNPSQVHRSTEMPHKNCDVFYSSLLKWSLTGEEKNERDCSGLRCEKPIERNQFITCVLSARHQKLILPGDPWKHQILWHLITQPFKTIV